MQHRHLSYWEIESFLKYKPSFISEMSRMFQNCDVCTRKLHSEVNRFSDDYRTLIESNPIEYPDLVESIKKELKEDKLLERNSLHPLFSPNNYCEESMGVRFRKNSNISPAFFISYLLAHFENKTIASEIQKGQVYMMAGELNYISYEKLRKYYFDLVLGNGLNNISKISCIAGPSFSCEDTFDKKVGSLVDANFFIKLFDLYPNQINMYHVEEREHFHFLVHEFDNSICLIEDFHYEFKEKGATLVFNNEPLCNALRRRAEKIIHSKDTQRIKDASTIRKYLRSKSEIESLISALS